MKLRITQVIKEKFPHLSHAQIKSYLKKGFFLVNGKLAKMNQWLEREDIIALVQNIPQSLSPNPDLACKILHQTKDFLFLEKPPFVHSVAHDFFETNSVANWLVSLNENFSDIQSLECGLVHRLDFETSGVMVAAKNKFALEKLKKLFQENKVEKIYTCLVKNPPPQAGIYTTFAGKHPKSKKRILLQPEIGRSRTPPTKNDTKKWTRIQTEILSTQKENDHYRLKIKLITGYRHQIRAHLAALGSSILGDEIYGKKEKGERLKLHAESLAFLTKEGEVLKVTSKCPF